MTLVGADTLNALPAQCQMDVMLVNATSSSGVSRRLLRELYSRNLVFTWTGKNATKVGKNAPVRRVVFGGANGGVSGRTAKKKIKIKIRVNTIRFMTFFSSGKMVQKVSRDLTARFRGHARRVYEGKND